MELVPIITTLLTYGVIVLSLLIALSYSVSKFRNGSKLNVETIETEENTRRIFQKQINAAQVRILEDKEEIKKGNIQYLHKQEKKQTKPTKDRTTKMTVLNSAVKTRYQILNEINQRADQPNIYSISGNF